MKYRDVKEQIIALTEEQLDQDIDILIADNGMELRTIKVYPLEEDLINMGYGLEPRSSYTDPNINDNEESAEEARGMEATFKAGTVIISLA